MMNASLQSTSAHLLALSESVEQKQSSMNIPLVNAFLACLFLVNSSKTSSELPPASRPGDVPYSCSNRMPAKEERREFQNLFPVYMSYQVHLLQASQAPSRSLVSSFEACVMERFQLLDCYPKGWRDFSFKISAPRRCWNQDVTRI